MVADIKSERWPASRRNGWPASVGIRTPDLCAAAVADVDREGGLLRVGGHEQGSGHEKARRVRAGDSGLVGRSRSGELDGLVVDLGGLRPDRDGQADVVDPRWEATQAASREHRLDNSGVRDEKRSSR